MPKSNPKHSHQIKLSPGIRAGQSIPFFELGAYTFQEFSRDLFDAEPLIATCDIYGVQGQTQDGIDLLAIRHNNDGIEVGQCKCYKDFTPTEIREASDEFFKHWDHWSTEDVKRFILFIASDLNTTQKQNQILTEKKRFAEVGIQYEVWTAATLRNKLRTKSGIVSNYLKPAEYWVKEICGASIGTPSFPNIAHGAFSGLFNAANELEIQFNKLVDLLSKETKESLERNREVWREGKREQALAWIDTLRTDGSRWEALTPDVRAQVLRFEAGLQLAIDKDASAADALRRDAFELDPSPENEGRIRALIALRERGPEAAIECLKGLSDIDSLNLLGSFYLDLDQKDQFQDILKTIENTLSPNAETYRLKAIMELMVGRVEQARSAMQNARVLAPKWVAVRYSDAVIDYCSSLSPVAMPKRAPLLPEPLDWALVRQDEYAIQQLREAANKFKGLLEEDQGVIDTELLQAWQLACAMMDPGRQEEAYDLIHSLLRSNPSYYHAIVWVLVRNLDIDLETSVQVLQRQVASGDALIPQIIALVGIRVKQHRFDLAEKILIQTKDVFVSIKAELLWVFWNTQVLVLAGHLKKAQRMLNRYGDSSEELREAQALILAARAKGGKDKKELVQYLELQYKQTKDPVFILQLCEVEYREQHWEHVAQYADLLIEAINTAEVVRLLVVSIYRANQFSRCLILINRHKSLFGSDRLPADIRRLRAACLQGLGRLRDAAAELESLPHDGQILEQLQQRAQIYVQIGDLKKLSLVGRQLASLPEAGPGDALWMAQILRQEDPALARSLWKKAVSQNLPEELVSQAMFVGFGLGLDAELTDISQKFYQIASKGTAEGVRVASIEDFLNLSREAGLQRQEMESLYLQGRLPIHVIADRVQVPLVDLYDEYLREKEEAPAPLKQSYLLVRHAAKEIDQNLITKYRYWHLHIDITAILLAEHFGIYEAVEKTFGQIYIPQELLPSLVEMRDSLLPHQPTQLQIAQDVVDLVESHNLIVIGPGSEDGDHTDPANNRLDRTTTTWLEFISDHGGYLLDFHDKISEYSNAQQGNANIPVVTSRDVAVALKQDGQLTENEFDNIIEALGTEGQDRNITLPLLVGEAIYCVSSIVEVIGRAGFLRLACKYFKLYVEESEHERCKATVALYKSRSETFQRLGELIEKLRKSLDAGRLEIIPTYAEGTSRAPGIEIPNLYGLRTLMAFPPEENDVTWVDDRYINGFSNRDEIPLIGINEILAALLESGEIDKSRYFLLLNRLRAANLRFIPLESDEILFHVCNAPIQGGALVETPALATLRMYLGALLTQGKILQRPPLPDGTPNQEGEVAYILRLGRDIADAVGRLWSRKDIDRSQKPIYGDWIISNLYTSHLGFSAAIGLEMDRQKELLMSALAIELLITQAWTMDLSLQPEGISVRKEYLNWLDNRLLERCFESNPAILQETAKIIKGMIESMRNDGPKEGITKDQERLIYQRLCLLLPERILEELKKDQSFSELLGIQPVVVLGEYDIKGADFWKAVHKTVNGQETEVLTLVQDAPIVLRPSKSQGKEFGIWVKDTKTSQQFYLECPEFVLLSDQQEEQEKVLRTHRSWFDCSEGDYNTEVSRILTTATPEARVEKVVEWRKADLGEYYANLHELLQKRKQFTMSELMPPSIDGMLRHYRLQYLEPNSPSFGSVWNDIANSFLEKDTIVQTLRRMWCIPSHLPESVYAAIKASEKPAKRLLIKNLLRSPKSPIALIQLTRLAFDLGAQDALYLRLARRMLHYLITDDFTTETESFLTILRWVSYRFDLIFQLHPLPVSTRLFLSWAHAHHLFSIFVSLGIRRGWIKDTFSGQFQLLSGVFRSDPAYEDDISHPRNVNSRMLTAEGIAYCAADYSKFLDNFTTEKVAQFMTMDVEGRSMPHPLLLRDSSATQNSLNSFLGDPLKERLSSLTTAAVAQLFEDSNLAEIAANLIQGLDGHENKNLAWTMLFAFPVSSTANPQIKAAMIDVLAKTDFVELCEESLQVGASSLQIAAHVALAVNGKELMTGLKNQLIHIVKQLADKYPGNEIRKLPEDQQTDIKHSSGLLMDAALSISKAETSSEIRAMVFNEICREMVGNWEYLAIVFRPLVELLTEILPPEEAKHMWQLLIFLRATPTR